MCARTKDYRCTSPSGGGRGNFTYKKPGEGHVLSIGSEISNAEDLWLLVNGSCSHICCGEEILVEICKQKKPSLFEANNEALNVEVCEIVILKVLNTNQEMV